MDKAAQIPRSGRTVQEMLGAAWELDISAKSQSRRVSASVANASQAKRRSSEADALHWQEAATVVQLASGQVSLSGPAEPTLSRMLAILAIALAMLGKTHLLVLQRFNGKISSLRPGSALPQHLEGPYSAKSRQRVYSRSPKKGPTSRRGGEHSI